MDVCAGVRGRMYRDAWVCMQGCLVTVCVYMGVEWMCVLGCECTWGLSGCVCRCASANVQGFLGVCAGVFRRMCRDAWVCVQGCFGECAGVLGRVCLRCFTPNFFAQNKDFIPGPCKNRLKLFRELFRFRENILLQNPKFACVLFSKTTRTP